MNGEGGTVAVAERHGAGSDLRPWVCEDWPTPVVGDGGGDRHGDAPGICQADIASSFRPDGQEHRDQVCPAGQP